MKRIASLILALGILVLGTRWAGAEVVINPGEKAVYSIKKLGIKVGTTTITFVGPQKLDGKDTVLIEFSAEGFNFYDREKIYMHPKTFLPVRVVRDLNIFGSKEGIVEYYDQAKGEVRIVKTVDAKATEFALKKPAPVDNIYSFVYRYRRQGRFVPGEAVTINLPTQTVVLTVKGREKVEALGQTQEAFFVSSVPEKYRVWFEVGDNKIPLRIDGAISFGNTAMIMREYSP